MTDTADHPEARPLPPWRVWVDTGGTFTDCLAIDPAGGEHRAKVLSTSALRGSVVRQSSGDTLQIEAEWLDRADAALGLSFHLLGERHPARVVAAWDAERAEVRLDGPLPGVAAGATFEVRSPEEAPVLAARLVTGAGSGRGLPPLAMRLATTRGTNALLERRGEAPALFVTRGFRDLLRIGTQQRPDLFALDARRPPPLASRVVEVPGRLDAAGEPLEPLEAEVVIPAARRLLRGGRRTAAIALLHAHADPAHEERLEAVLRAEGFEHVARSSAVAPGIGLLQRAETAVVDAYLAPVIGAYLASVRASVGGEAGGASLHMMTSAGGLVRAEGFAAKDSLLSGPAGGVVGAALAGRRAGEPRVIAFDMGGTSTDVSRIDGEFDYVWEHTVGDAHLLAPALAIETVAAGGGSVCRADGGGLRVGPESAGADPGPACYGAGGPLTLTDANLLLGRLDPARFGIPIDRDAAWARLEELRDTVAARGDQAPSPEALLHGLLALADERMADAIRRISVRRGYDPAEYALVAFGGAGPQHACGVAARLGMRTVVVPRDAGLLSALGLGHAVIERFAARQLLAPLAGAEPRVPELVAALEAEAVGAVVAEGVPREGVEVRRRIASLRFAGQESTLEVEWAAGVALGEAFRARYRELFGHAPDDRAVELESLRVVASSLPAPDAAVPPAEPHPARPAGSMRAWWPDARGAGWRDVPTFDRAALAPGATFAGPALVREAHSTTVVEAGWTAEAHPSGALLLRRGAEAEPAAGAEGEIAAVREELFVHRFQALVGEMGERLRRTALSVNVRERLDFSCALLDAGGELVANAPHIPVHLGALGVCVREVARALPLQPGDVAVTNHPGFGGSHLPDVTVVAPVHTPEGELIGYVANRAHHAEIGGTRPGSMPPNARSLGEEGVVIAPTLLVRGGAAEWERVRELLLGAPHPTRAVEDNLADLRAQVAAAHHGAGMLRRLAAAHGAEEVRRQMRALTGRAERRAREALGRLPDGVYQATERLDDGSPLAARIEVRGETALFDFAGSAGVHPGNLNATPAVVRSVVLYVLRLLVGEPLPLNEGLLRTVELRIPEGILAPTFPPDAAAAPAVVGGNVETSQRLVDALLRALRLAAGSQGTMNNVLFGNERFGYYETVCGGAGAGPGWDGGHAVHTHMTNTRITDPEVLEHRYPVRVERFGLRRGSGGAGRWIGGDGVVRELRFLEPVALSVLTQHRREGPFGMDGGEGGRVGRQWVVRAGGERLELGSIDGADLQPGDRLVLLTPGGGGWGPARWRRDDRG